MKKAKIIKKDDIENKVMNNQKKVLILSILCMVILLISSSYAIMTNFTQKEDAITFTTGNLEMTILNGEETFSLINLNNRLPESDESGLAKSTVIPITLKNTGTMLIGTYDVKLVAETETENISTLNEDYIRFSVSEDNVTYSTPTTLSDSENIIFSSNNLEVEATKTIYLKIWVIKTAPETVLNNTYYGAISVDLEQYVEDEPTGADIIINKYGIDETLVAVNTDGTLYNGDGTIREYRYSGATANNYVFFDTNGDGVKDANEIWRIVGVFKNSLGDWNLKLMRNTMLTSAELPATYTYDGTTFTIEDGTTGYALWNSTKTTTNYSDWTTAGLQYFLNGEDGYFGTFSTKMQSLIDDNYTYYLGNYGWNVDTPVSVYQSERGTTECDSSITDDSHSYNCNIWYGNKATWNGAISLLYASDYGYSASSTYWSNTTLYTFKNAAYATSWMNLTANHTTESLLNPSSDDTTRAARWMETGYVNDWYTNYNNGVRPALNLVSNVKFEANDVDGSETNPYVINLEQDVNSDTSVITNARDVGFGKITFTIKDSEIDIDKYCVNQSQEDTTNCTWYDAVVGVQTTETYVNETGIYYIHTKDIEGNVEHSSPLKMTITYNLLEYIETTGTQYINTGFNPNPATTKVETLFQLTDDSVVNQGVFGSRGTAGAITTTSVNIFYISTSGVFRLDWLGANSTAAVNLNIDIEMICENNVVTINGTNYSSTASKSTTYLTYPIYIGNLNNAGTASATGAYSKFKYFKIYDNGTLVRDYLPVERIADGVLGLYDQVENKFYENAGSGTFTDGTKVGVL